MAYPKLPAHLLDLNPVSLYRNTMYGWTGKILHINLTTQNFQVETPGIDFYQKHLGGKGMGGYYLRQCATLPFDHPDMVVSIFTGPLVATIAPTSGRAHLVSKSP